MLGNGGGLAFLSGGVTILLVTPFQLLQKKRPVYIDLHCYDAQLLGRRKSFTSLSLFYYYMLSPGWKAS